MNLAGAIVRLASGTYTVIRGAAGNYGSPEDGRYAPAATTTLQVKASIQPLSEADLERLPEGERTHDRIVIYTTTPLQTAIAPDGAPADIVTWQGKQYQVEETDVWTETAGYGRYIARKIGQ